MQSHLNVQIQFMNTIHKSNTIRVVVKKKIDFFSSLLLLRGPLVVPWAIQILGPYFNVAVDAIGPETDITLESNRKKLKTNY